MKTFIIILLSIFLVISPIYSDDEMSIFTEEELNWLEDHPVILVAPEDDYAPIEYYIDGKFLGLSNDYLNWISKQYNIQFEFVYYKTWSEILEALKNNEVDLQSAIVKTPARSEYLDFTISYANVPNIVLVRRDFNTELSIATLFDYKVGVIKDYAVHEYIKLVYAPSDIVEYIDVRESLTDLSLGQIDALIIDLAQASYYIQDMAISNVIISNDVEIDFEYRLSFATNKDSEMLISILDKAIDSMPLIKKQELFSKWIYLGNNNSVDKKIVTNLIALIGITLLFFLIAMIWSVILKRKVKDKTKDLNVELLHSKTIEQELSLLTMELEERVAERSESLIAANNNLELSMKEVQEKKIELSKINVILEEQIDVLEETQVQLVESEKLNALSRLVIGIAHEINTPLGSGITVVSYANSIILKINKIMKSNDGLDDIDKIEDYINELLCSTDKALLYLQQTAKIVRDFSMVANYNYENNVKEIVLDENIQHIINVLKSHQYFTHYKFNLDLQPDIKINTSKGGLLQVISALVENCYYHGYKESHEGVIDITLNQEDDIIKLIIRDYGIGMTEDMSNKIFEPFYTSMRGSNRMGLGLYSAYNIITGVLNGKISVVSQPNEGSIFTITFKKNR